MSEDELPEGWANATLEELGEWGSGGTPLRTRREYFAGGTIPWLKIGDLNDGIVTSAAEAITDRGLQGSSAKILPKGVLLVAMYGSIGKLGITGIPCATNQAIAFCQPRRDRADLRFLFWMMRSKRDALLDLGKGGTQQNISQTVLRTFEVPIPPLAEQKRIVAKVDDLLARVNAARERLARVPAILKSFRQAFLAAACDGRLTAQWRKAHFTKQVKASLNALAPRLDSRPRRGVPESVDTPEVIDSLELPESWGAFSVAQLLRQGALLDVKDGNHGANHPKVADFTAAGLPFITAAQVKGFQIDYDGAYRVSGKPLKKLHVGFAKPGDAVLTHKGSVGRSALNSRECVLTPQTTYYRPNVQIINPGYLVFLFAAPQFYSQLAQVMSQTTRDFVPISEQYRLFLILPPQEEQDEIVRRVEEFFKIADAVEKRVASATVRAERLTQAILAKAFRGELVPTEAELARRKGQGYEPATELLERVKGQPVVTVEAGRRRASRPKVK